MQLSLGSFQSFKVFATVVIGIFALASCSSSQAVYDDDGIYSKSNAETVSQEVTGGTTGNGVAYKNYFEQGAEALEEIPEEGAIFTDIESYTSEEGSEGAIVYEDDAGFETGRAAWGEETEDVTLNIYPNNNFYGGFGFNRFGFGGFNGWGYGGWGYGGFNNWGYGGFNGWGWGGAGFGFGNPWNPFCYGYGGFNGYYNNFNNGGYGRRTAYNGSRRTSASSAIAASRTRLRENGRRTTNRSTYSRGRGTSRPTTTRGIARPNNSGSRPSNSARPVNGSRPSNASRPNGSRPSNASRPRGNGRPSNASRPRGNSRPSSGSRPSNASRPRGNSKPSSTSRSRSSSSRGASARSSSSRSSSGSRGGSSRRGGGRG
ncbi:MAG: hypothetical protein ACI86L_001374 [Dokdonia sp.]|jgi:hypothetical protein